MAGCKNCLYGPCGCVKTKPSCKKPICRKPVQSIMVNGVNSNQDTIEFLGECLIQEIVQDGCAHKLQITFPCVENTDAVSVLVPVVSGQTIATHDDGEGNLVNIEESLTTLVNNNDGTYTYTNEAGVQTVIDINEIDMDINSVVANGAVITFTSEDGTTVDLDICQLVADNCNATLVENPDGSYTHTSNAGVQTTIAAHNPSDLTRLVNGNPIAIHDNGYGSVKEIEETVTTITENADGRIGYTNEAGQIVYVHEKSDITRIIGNGNPIATHDDGYGSIKEIEESITTLVNNNDGTFTYTNEVGDETIITLTNDTDTTYNIVNNTDGTFTFTGSDGTNVVIDICSMIADGGCSDGLVDNGDGSFTHTALDGTAVTFTVSNSSVTPIVTGNIIANHTDGSGAVTAIEETVTTLVNNNDGTYTFTSESGVQTVIDVNEIDMDINNVVVSGSVVTFTAEDGSNVAVDICQIVADNCNSSLTVNPDGSLTHVANDGTITNVAAPAASNTSVVNGVVTGQTIATHDDGQGNVVNIQETITTLTSVPAADGTVTYTYTNEDGTAVPFCVGALVQDHVGNTVNLDCTAKETHRTLHVAGDTHGGSTANEFLIVSVLDSEHNGTALSGITTLHNKMVFQGSNATVSGEFSSTGGRNNNHSGNDGFSHGVNMDTSGLGSYSFGANGTNSGTRSLNVGLGNDVSGNQTNAFGRDGTVSGNYGGIGGIDVTLSGGASFAWGNNITSTGDQSATFGNTQQNLANGALLGGGDSVVTGQRSINWGSFLDSDAEFSATFGSQHLVGKASATSGHYSLTTGSDNITDTRHGTTLGYAIVNSGAEYAHAQGAGISPASPLIQDQERSQIFGYDSDQPAVYIDNEQLTGGAGRLLINGINSPTTASALQALFGTNSVFNIQGLPTHADAPTAVGAGMLPGDVFKDANGFLRVV